MKDLIKQEFRGWELWEAAWLFIAVIAIFVISIIQGETLLGIVSATTGTACVVLTGKGKLSAYVFGLINVVLYAYISYQATLYGETMLNALYYLPMQFIGWFAWKKHMDSDSSEVVKRRLTIKGRLLSAVIVASGTVVYGIILRTLGDMLPFTDAFTTVASVYAMFVSVNRFAEQWIVWIAVDAVSIYMWAIAFVNTSAYIATLMMWCVYLVNAVIMLIRWMKECHDA